MIKVINSGKTTNINGSNGSAIKVGNTTVSDVIVNGKLVYHPDNIHIFYSLGVLGVASDFSLRNDDDKAFPFGVYYTVKVVMSGKTIHNLSGKTAKGEHFYISHHSSEFVWAGYGSVNISIKPFINDAQTEYGTEYKYSMSNIPFGETHLDEAYYL